ncbi:peptide ABC transporter permease [Rossellomorea marisflavi]|uniref:nickel transporter permease n=1 Tax=Rossellomorea marisflavi TaxID=189381 RepID=UPI0025C9A75E|nr:nickel transporter permease [Rossellomorea marisflavi]GLI85345.1 peptide ABC transporter permease [Rossellomorea marisflavi]
MKGWHKPALLILFALMVLGSLSVYTFLILGHAPDDADLARRLKGMSMDHLLGTDHLGRDVLSRILSGGVTTVGFSLLALGAALLIGIPIGIYAGYKGGLVDRIFMRIADGFLSFPDTIVAIVLAGMMGPGIVNLVLSIMLVKWVNYARLVRSTVLTESGKDYVLMAKVNGLTQGAIMRRHLLPHLVGNVVVLASLDLGKIILLLSAFSYIGLGAQPPAPEWGAMLNEARPYFQTMPQLMLAPGMAIVITVFVTNLLGDHVRDLYDVKREVDS